MTLQLDGKRILLTGASRGVGRATARLLLQNGAKILGISKNAERLESTRMALAAEGLTELSTLAVDLTSAAAPLLIQQRIEAEWGELDVAIMNAGIQYNNGGIMSEPVGMLESSLEQNLIAPFRLARAILPSLLRGEQPRLVNVSSGAGTLAALSEPNIASYRLSKWALGGLTLLQAQEFTGKIHVCAFDPGWVKTDLGGPNAPGTTEEAALGLLQALLVPWEESGKFYKDGQVISW